jgi:hypothetical protein
LREYLDFLATKTNFINEQSIYEAFFYIGKACFYYKETELDIYLEKNAAQIFTKTLASLYEKREELKFNSETNIETGDEPNGFKDFKESIFSYILFSMNILCKNLVRLKKGIRGYSLLNI